MEGVVVVVIVIGERNPYVHYTKGRLPKEDIDVLIRMDHWNREERQSQLKESPHSRESQVLQKIFRYNKDGVECADVFERTVNASQHGPYHVVIFKN